MDDTRPDPNVRVFGSPHRYYQGPDALEGLPRICAQSGSTPFLVVDADVLALLGDRLAKSSRTRLTRSRPSGAR